MTAAEAAAVKKWRDVLRVHPAAELFPLMSEAELRELGEDILKNGMRVPIVILARDNAPGLLLDGRNRLDALELLAVNVPRLLIKAQTLTTRMIHLRVRRVCEPGASCLITAFSEDKVHDPWAYVISANIHRRHLAAEQRREVIAKLIAARPERSDRAVARDVGVDGKTIAAIRREGENCGTIPQLKKRIGLDGKARAKPKGKVPLDNPARPRNHGQAVVTEAICEPVDRGADRAAISATAARLAATAPLPATPTQPSKVILPPMPPDDPAVAVALNAMQPQYRTLWMLYVWAKLKPAEQDEFLAAIGATRRNGG